MQRLFATLFATTAITVAGPALAASGDAVTVCDNAFIQGDTDSDGQMSQEEITAHRDAVYEDLDANNDGSIDREEYVACLGQARQAARDVAVEAEQSGESRPGKWSELETDETGVSARDFADRVREAWESEDTDSQANLAGSQDHDSAESLAKAAVDRFHMLDSDGDGIVTKEEYERPATQSEWSEEALNARFDTKDADNSGGISPQEFRGAITWAPSPGQTSGVEGQAAENANQTQSDDGATQDTAKDGTTVPVFYYYIELL